MTMKNIFKHWKTTSAGIVAIVTGVMLYIGDKTKVVEALTAILGGLGLIFAADAPADGTDETASN